jgi:hypothetical protein
MSKLVKRIAIGAGVLCVAGVSAFSYFIGFNFGFGSGDGAATSPAAISSELVAALESKPDSNEKPAPGANPEASAAESTPAVAIAPLELDDIFPVSVAAEIGGKKSEMKLTGHAIRKASLLKFYKIGSYCCSKTKPSDVDALVAADVPKQLLLVMVRPVKKPLLERSFRETFEKNDPDNKFVAEIQTMLDYMTRTTLETGDHVVITHLPNTGISVRRKNQEEITVANPAFATVVWNVYMGPLGVSEDLRKGLGKRL